MSWVARTSDVGLRDGSWKILERLATFQGSSVDMRATTNRSADPRNDVFATATNIVKAIRIACRVPHGVEVHLKFLSRYSVTALEHNHLMSSFGKAKCGDRATKARADNEYFDLLRRRIV
jgi:hypothetical protein